MKKGDVLRKPWVRTSVDSRRIIDALALNFWRGAVFSRSTEIHERQYGSSEHGMLPIGGPHPSRTAPKLTVSDHALQLSEREPKSIPRSGRKS
jgi:hypothetical protein